MLWRRRERLWPDVIPRRAITGRRFTIPLAWLRLSPGKPASFWIRIERMRQEAGLGRGDIDGISYLIRLQRAGITHHQSPTRRTR